MARELKRIPIRCFGVPRVPIMAKKRKRRFMSLLQSRALAFKTIAPACSVVRFLRSEWPDSRVVWASHPAEGTTPKHIHGVAVFGGVTRWGRFRDFLMRLDPHSYSDSCRSVCRSVRYLLHLDNPEKVKIPFASLHSENWDDDDLAQYLHGSGRGSVLDYLPAIIEMPVYDALRYCEQQGIAYRDVTQALNCMIALDRVKRHVPVGNSFDRSFVETEEDTPDPFVSDYDFSLSDVLGGQGGEIP